MSTDDTSGVLDADRIRGLLTELGQRMDARGLSAHLFLVGGAAMALAFNTRRVTRDLDALFEPKSEIYAEAAVMAAEQGLPADWLNDGVKGLLPDRVGPESGLHFESPGLTVEVASAEYLFAMKASAARGAIDTADLRYLADHLGLRDAEEALDLLERFYSSARLRPTTQFLLQDIFAERSDALAADGDIDVSTAELSRPARAGDGRVSPYRRQDGTYVKGHHRRQK
jgi:hypothetical protein